MPSHAPGLQRNQSLQRAVELLRALAVRREGATATELARASGLPVPTVRRLVATLADAGLAERVPGSARWVLGHELIRLGRAADPHVATIGRARPLLERLADESGETTILGASRLPYGVDVICQVDAPRMVGIASWMGRAFGLHASAGARLAFAALPDDDVRAILGPGPFFAYTSRTITDLVSYLDEVRVVRRTRVAVSVDELELGLTTIAVPIGEDSPFSVGVSGPTFRLGASRRDELVPVLRASAEAIALVIAG